MRPLEPTAEDAGRPNAWTTSPATRLTISFPDGTLWRHTPLSHEIIRRAKQAGIAYAHATRAIEGIGPDGRIHSTRILSLTDAVPIVVTVIDSPAGIERFLDQLAEISGRATVVMDQVHLVGFHTAADAPGHHRSRHALPAPGGDQD
ncbi:DUF190 domain-containing protein [Kitasatospora sp. NPDC059673]|uniref:DUF190 domain-containing protein n=1 Tax=Kitasatospora sp. NPDC059673 TaxID=3346901 RepID=UPI003684099C